MEPEEGPAIRHLAEIVLWSRDVERSLMFYRDLLGLADMTPPGMANRFLRVAAGPDGVPEMMVLVPRPESALELPSEKIARPLHHLAFAVAAEAYDELCARLLDAGHEVRGGVHPVLKAVRTAYVDDPDGNEVELIAPVG